MKTLFELNPALDIAAHAARFAATGRVQLQGVLTAESPHCPRSLGPADWVYLLLNL